MPIRVPAIDDRSYDQLRAEALARIPSHNPEWTNFTEADPGVTLLELFAFLTESLLYRANQIPERNRRAFLSLLRVPLQPAVAARGLVTLANEAGPQEVRTLGPGLELRAGKVPFRTEQGVDVLPVEARAFRKRRLTGADDTLRGTYDALYTAQKLGTDVAGLDLYVATPFPEADGAPVDLGDGDAAVDHSLWIALLVRANDARGDLPALRQAIRGKLKQSTLNLGLAVAAPADQGRVLRPDREERAAAAPALTFQLPDVQPLPADDAKRDARYATVLQVPLPAEPGVVGVPLPAEARSLGNWEELRPLEEGTRDFPPAVDDPELAARVITWLRIRCTADAPVRLTWIGINAVGVTQRGRVEAERLPDGTGEPDQQATLSHGGVLDGTVRIAVAANGGAARAWTQVPELLAAPAERPAVAGGVAAGSDAEVFALDAEAGLVRFGDGVHGARPPAGAKLQASYDHAQGRAGNVGPDTIRSGPDLPAGFTVSNPLPIRGGADPESVEQGERQVARWLQHRDRLVSSADFEALALRTPGADVGRVEVLPAYHPTLSREPGDAPGTVTLVAIPRGNPYPPTVDGPDAFLAAIACWLEPRRLVTTELHLRRPQYVPVWVSVGVNAVAGLTQGELKKAIEDQLASFLSPLPDAGVDPLVDQLALFDRPQLAAERRGWPLRTPVSASELLTWVARVPGVQRVRGIELAGDDGRKVDALPMEGLQLPRLAGVAVVIGGDPPEVASLLGSPSPATSTKPLVPVPVVPEECR